MSLLSDNFLSQYKGVTPKNAGVLFYPVYLRTYSRWLPEQNRRERWDETVERVVNYSMGLYQGPASREELQEEAEILYDHIFNLKVLPAGRTLWVGGTKSSEKFPESQYNCSYTTIDRLDAFTDLFHLLLCGCGVGFRVLPTDVEQLPKVYPISVTNLDYNPILETRQEQTQAVESDCLNIIRVGDSREAWVDALRIFLKIATTPLKGSDPHAIVLDYDNVRPKGERIKSFGGHAPGPYGLMEMFTNLGNVINKSKGQLSPIDCVDICNYIGKNVIVGGTRRSSQIALGCIDDPEFVDAKKDLWTSRQNLQRTMSNNSVVFESKPSFEEVQRVFQGIKNNGEPGFFNLEAARKRRPNAQGINPCLTSDTWIATENGPRQIKDLLTNSFVAVVDNQKYKATPFWSSGVKEVFKLNTREGYSLKLTKNHKMLTSNRGWVEAGDLIVGDSIVLNNLKEYTDWEGNGSFREGWLLGSLVGDGTFASKYRAELRYWGNSQQVMSVQAKQYMDDCVPHRSDCSSMKGSGGHLQVACAGIGRLAEQFGITRECKVNITKEIEVSSSNFYKGFLQGIFDADGSAQGSKSKGCSVRLTQSNLPFLQGIQRMLLRLGIKSVIYPVRRKAGMRLLPNGKGGSSYYFCKDASELIISRESLSVFYKQIGFSEPAKQQRLAAFVSSDNKRGMYRDKLEAQFVSLEPIGTEEVFDCTVEEVHRFDANGLIAHNCAEILMDSNGFCNLATVNWKAFTSPEGFDVEKAEKALRLAVRVTLRMTNVTVTLPHWDFIQKRDRLLGDSLTGLMDAMDLMSMDPCGPQAISIYNHLHFVAREEADFYAFEMRIPSPLLVTTIKPEGCWTKEFIRTTDQGLLFIDEIDPEIDNVQGFHDIRAKGISTHQQHIYKTFNKGKSPIIKVLLENNRLLKITPTHPMAISYKGGPSNFRWVEAQNLKVGDSIIYKLGNYTNSQESNLLCTLDRDYRSDAMKVTLPSKMSPDLAWLLGLYWGDGCFTGDKRIKLIGRDLNIHQKAQRLWKELFSVDTKIVKCSDRDAYTQDFSSIIIRDWLTKNELAKESHEYLTRIPREIRSSSSESIIAFIAGLSDADGCYASSSMCIDNKSESFIRHLQEVGEAVGLSFGFSTNAARNNTHSRKPVYKVHLSRTNTLPEAIEILNKHSVKAITKPVIHSLNCKSTTPPYVIKSIELLEEEEVAYDIEVSNSHWYYQGALKSHNTLSQLPTVSSGLHRAYAPYYIRRIRVSDMDPVCKALQKLGVPNEPDRSKAERVVFSFPIKTDAKISANQEPARDQFNRYLTLMENYVDHNASCTLTVGEDEWEEIEKLVYENFDKVVAVAFLPKYTDAYPQLPYEEITKEQYEEMIKSFPDLSNLPKLVDKFERGEEFEDELDSDCSGGQCPIR